MKISIVTATYNRCDLLPKLYNSLVSNYKTFKDFEWVIMDDGSSDKTDDLVKKWQSEASFAIKYYYQENMGKMNAINNVVRYVSGDIFIEVDSDDYLLPNALKMISDDYLELGNKNVYGILYKKKISNKNYDLSHLDNKVITLFDMHNKYEYDCDMSLTFKTDIRKTYFYELENNEKFVTEARLYYKLDQLYDGLIFKNKEIIVSEYMTDGYSSNIRDIYKKYPYGFWAYFKECLSYRMNGVTFKRRLYFIKHYILFSYLTHKRISECIKSVKGLNKLLVVLLVLPGYVKSSRF